MSGLSSFEPLLKEVVTAKRLSASKMSKLTDIALKNMENDTELVSTLYRTHKSLASSSKISSLYAFDALARAARHQTTKHNLVVDVQKGNAATFLAKMEGVLEGLFADMLSFDIPEAKEKTNKVLDIWTKSNTFPTGVLTRLSELAKKAVVKVPESATTAPTQSADPRTLQAVAGNGLSPIGTAATSTTPPSANGVNPSASALPPALLALLSQTLPGASNGSTNGSQQPPPTTGFNVDPAQLALLQQLASLSSVPVQNAPPLAPVPVPIPIKVDHSPPSDYQDSRREYPDRRRDRDARSSRWDAGPSHSRQDSRPYSDRGDRSPPPSGSYGYRGDSSGGYRGHREGNYNGRPRDNHRSEWGPRLRSRSRSPPPGRYDNYRGERGGRGSYGGYGGGRGGRRPYSPPPRRDPPPSRVPIGREEPDSVDAPKTSAPEPGKDEFGRDVRPGSPKSPTATQPPPGSPRPPTKPPASSSTLQVESQPASNPPPPAQTLLPTTSKSVGLDSYDYSKFDPTSPESWVSLGIAFSVTYQRQPSQEELMSLVMSGGQPIASYGATITPGGYQAQPHINQNTPFMRGQPVPVWDSGREDTEMAGDGWRGTGNRGFQRRGRGGNFSRGGHNSAGYSQPYNDYQETDAVVLGGGGDETSMDDFTDGAEVGGTSGDMGDGESSRPGAMKRVGDRWVWQP